MALGDPLLNAEMIALEKMVDASSLTGVLRGLAEIAQAKAQHIREAWQDEALAKSWERSADKITTAANTVVRDYGV